MSEESFKVIDRRRFNEDGEKTQKEENVNTEPKLRQEAPKPGQEEPKQASQPEQGFESSIDFSSFIVSMATQALMLLGEVPHPETGEKIENIEAAKQTIDIISVLEEKTQGNLTRDEERLIGDVLASLRLAYVNKNKK